MSHFQMPPRSLAACRCDFAYFLDGGTMQCPRRDFLISRAELPIKMYTFEENSQHCRSVSPHSPRRGGDGPPLPSLIGRDFYEPQYYARDKCVRRRQWRAFSTPPSHAMPMLAFSQDERHIMASARRAIECVGIPLTEVEENTHAVAASSAPAPCAFSGRQRRTSSLLSGAQQSVIFSRRLALSICRRREHLLSRLHLPHIPRPINIAHGGGCFLASAA